MHKNNAKSHYLRMMVLISVILALLVLMLGAYTRLTNAGLGCPDWPGCYGKMVLPQGAQALKSAQLAFPEVPLESKKAWTEMIHRYAAGCLGLLIFSIALIAIGKRLQDAQFPWKLPLILMVLVVFQALLGMWTVTMKLLPLVVMGHLLGGMLIFVCLSYFWWQLSSTEAAYAFGTSLISPSGTFSPGLGRREKGGGSLGGKDSPQWRIYIILGIIIIFMQIALGGWVSSNYAGVACLGFPTCNGNWLPTLHFAKAFNISLTDGLNYQGGMLDNEVRITIQMVHRFGALLTAIYVLTLSTCMILKSNNQLLKRTAWVLALLVILQFTLGVLNVIYWLPIQIAVAHNGVAALLLATMASTLYFTRGAVSHDY